MNEPTFVNNGGGGADAKPQPFFFQRAATAIAAMVVGVHTAIAERSLKDLFGVAKSVVVVAAATLPTLAAVVFVTKAMIETPVVLAPIRVPDSFEKQGFSGEVATQRLLDEVAKLNRASMGSKDKTNVGDTNMLDAISNIQISVGGFDAKTIQALIRTAVGKRIIQLSGEITTRKEGDQEIVRLHLRQSPGRIVLIDVETARGADDLFAKSALNLLEHIDPEIAAGIHWREYGNIEQANKLIAAALSSHDREARKLAYNLKSFILASQGQIDEALATSDIVKTFGDAEFPGLNSRAIALSFAKRHDEALEAARMTVRVAPDQPSTHNTLGFVLQGMGRNDEAVSAYTEALKLNRYFGMTYRRLAAAQRAVGKQKAATETLLQGLASLPDSAGLLFDYAEDLRRRKLPQEALSALRKAFLLAPENWAIAAALAENELELGNTADGSRVINQLKARIAAGGTAPPNIKPRIEALLQGGLGAPATQSSK